MKVLALTHAHLSPDGLSPVSCERADSIVDAWASELKWEIDVVHTKNTLWRGIWPDGEGMNIAVTRVAAPDELMMGPRELFSKTFRALLAKGSLAQLAVLVARRAIKRTRAPFVARGWIKPHELAMAEKWGRYLFAQPGIGKNKYDFIFVCVGHGDEYLLQTALVLSEKLKTPMVVDFRDLWSEHHEENRFTEQQRQQLRKLEFKLLRKTILLSVPQKPMAAKLGQYLKIPVHLTSHSAFTAKNWADGKVIKDEFTMLYAGKMYAGNPGLDMLLDLLKKLSALRLERQVKCHFYVDDPELLKTATASKGLAGCVAIHGWVAPEVIWGEMRSAHLLLIFDGGFFRDMQLIMTKTYQYARTGRPILALSKNGNEAYEELFLQYNAGRVCSDTDKAVAWIKELMASPGLYEYLPQLRKVPTRQEIAVEFAHAIENVLRQQLYL